MAAVITRISDRMPPIFSTPPPSPPSRCSAGTSTSSSRISPVSEARTDIFSIFLPSAIPRIVARSRRKSAMFFIPRSAEVFAATVRTSATGALVTQVLPPDRLRALLVDDVRAHERLHGGGRGHRERAARQLLGEEAVGHHVGVGAAVGLRVAEAEVAELAQAPEELRRELRPLVERLGRRRHLGVDEPRDGPAEVFLLRGEADHARTFFRSSRVAVSSTRRSIPEPAITTPYSRRAAPTDT